MKWSVVLLIILTSILSISQTILYAFRTPPGFVFPLIHNFVEDYYQYLDIMRQGFDGWWVATSRLTPDVYPRMVVSVFLLFLGHIARVLHISLPVAYTGARIFGGVALMTLVYQLIRRTFPQSFPKRLVALCFVLFGASFWGWSPDGLTVASLTHAWTELDPIFRWSFVPHHLWSKVGMVAVFLLMLRPRMTIRRGLVLAVAVFLAGMTNPVVYATLVPTLLIYIALTVCRRSRLSLEIIGPVVAIAVSGAVLLYHLYLQTHLFPWTSYAVWEQTLLYAVNPFEYVLSLGPAFVLFILAIPAIWRLGRVGSLYLSWAASSWFMLYVAGPFLPVTPERSLGGYQFIPLGIGAVEGVWVIASFVNSNLSSPRFPSSSPRRRGSSVLFHGVLFLFVSAIFIYSAVGLYASLAEHAGYVAANRNNPQVYVSGDVMAAFSYLSSHGKPEEVVMAPYEISTMIPAFTGKRVMAGHAMFTQDVATKRSGINEFFATRDAGISRRILGEYPIRWVVSPASWRPPWNVGEGWAPVFQNISYLIYRILR